VSIPDYCVQLIPVKGTDLSWCTNYSNG